MGLRRVVGLGLFPNIEVAWAQGRTYLGLGQSMSMKNFGLIKITDLGLGLSQKWPGLRKKSSRSGSISLLEGPGFKEDNGPGSKVNPEEAKAQKKRCGPGPMPNS